jgi:energy-coupling factor transporter ATP-binding protein EcfA2
LALRPVDALRHTHVIGPTGVGKSTLLANLITQDMAAGYGVTSRPKRSSQVTRARRQPSAAAARLSSTAPIPTSPTSASKTSSVMAVLRLWLTVGRGRFVLLLAGQSNQGEDVQPHQRLLVAYRYDFDLARHVLTPFRVG